MPSKMALVNYLLAYTSNRIVGFFLRSSSGPRAIV